MSYQVLARKWRPRSFDTLIGQDHVVRALTHALTTGRLHHAYLFTGTRGVGKTTLSRILAKALNCETGVTPTPCGVCGPCQEIEGGRFVDYVEMDAASNRGVDDMAALLEQAVYTPSRGRYKVFMIDEVHMLTGHAFNAMLKTLEEPPEHMKFILATTDPQKIPITVLSRCLQFNLKQMPQAHIVSHLSHILTAETIPFETAALRHIAKAASGSMRDALSLLDQAIAHGLGKVEEEGVSSMLGTVGDDYLFGLLEALRNSDIDGMLAVAANMESRSLSFESALQAIASLFHRVALVQFSPEAIIDSFERERLQIYASAFDPEFVQLAYQIVIHGRDELALAPDEYTGFSMTLLRLHAFRPDYAHQPALKSTPRQQDKPSEPAARVMTATPIHSALSGSSAPSPSSNGMATTASVVAKSVEAAQQSPAIAAPTRTPVEASVNAQSAVINTSVGQLAKQPIAQSAAESTSNVESTLESPLEMPAVESLVSTPPVAAERIVALNSMSWHEVISKLSIGGMVRELASHSECLKVDESSIVLRIPKDKQHLLAIRSTQEKLQEAVSGYFSKPLKLSIEIGELAHATLAEVKTEERARLHQEAVKTLAEDPFVQQVITRFDATLVEDSIKTN